MASERSRRRRRARRGSRAPGSPTKPGPPPWRACPCRAGGSDPGEAAEGDRHAAAEQRIDEPPDRGARRAARRRRRGRRWRDATRPVAPPVRTRIASSCSRVVRMQRPAQAGADDRLARRSRGGERPATVACSTLDTCSTVRASRRHPRGRLPARVRRGRRPGRGAVRGTTMRPSASSASSTPISSRPSRTTKAPACVAWLRRASPTTRGHRTVASGASSGAEHERSMVGVLELRVAVDPPVDPDVARLARLGEPDRLGDGHAGARRRAVGRRGSAGRSCAGSQPATPRASDARDSEEEGELTPGS